MRVSPFRHPRIDGYLLLPGAFRSLSRLSSAPSAKASAPRLIRLTSPVCIALHAGGRLVASNLLFVSGGRTLSYAAPGCLDNAWIIFFVSVCSFQGAYISVGILYFRRVSTSSVYPALFTTDGLKWTRTTDLTLIRRAL